MDCCGSKKDDKKNDANQGNTGQDEVSHSHGGCCGGNPWVMVVMVILMAIVLFLTRR